MIQVTMSDLKQKVQDGWKKQQLAEHYSLPVAQMTKLLQQAGLKIRKFGLPKFELVDDTAPMEVTREESFETIASIEVVEEVLVMPPPVVEQVGEVEEVVNTSWE